MSLRRIATAASTIVVAIVVALTVPVSQLRTVSIVKQCCCPDPHKCHCPDHQPDHKGQSSMRACHSTQHVTVSPEAPSFAAPPIAIAAGSSQIALLASPLLDSPHAPPSAAPPYGPS